MDSFIACVCSNGGSLRVLAKREKSSFIWHLFDGSYAYFGFKHLLEVFLANKDLCDGYWSGRCHIAE